MTDHESEAGNHRVHPSYLSPDVLDPDIRTGSPSAYSGGLPAVTVALTMAIKQMGVARTVSSLLDLTRS